MTVYDTLNTKRTKSSRISGRAHFGASSSPNYTMFDRQVVTEWEKKVSHWTPFPVWRRFRREYAELLASAPGALHMVTHSDFGAAFFHEKGTTTSNLNNLTVGGSFSFLNQSYSSQQKGPVLLGVGSTPHTYLTDQQVQDTQAILFGLGATAINRVRPNKPTVDLAVTIGELRFGGLPTMMGSMMARSMTLRDVFRNSGREYLNAQFGWAPLMRDLTALCNMVTQSKKVMEQHERDISRLIRRRYYFDPEVSTSYSESSSFIKDDSRYWFMSNTPVGYNNSTNVQTWLSNEDRAQIYSNVKTQTWFSGAFRFYERSVPEALERLSEFESQANLLLGTRLDPEVLWNLQPWSWLADWFVNFGDVLGNVSAIVADQLVVQHGYIMRTETVTTETTVRGYKLRSGNLGTQWLGGYNPISNTSTVVRQHRAKAHPFGFGLNPTDFSSSQWAILAALGMSRVR